jgi:hypothetical protein
LAVLEPEPRVQHALLVLVQALHAQLAQVWVPVPLVPQARGEALEPRAQQALPLVPAPVWLRGAVRGLPEPDEIQPSDSALNEASSPVAMLLPVSTRAPRCLRVSSAPGSRAFPFVAQHVLNPRPAQIQSNESRCAGLHESLPRFVP